MPDITSSIFRTSSHWKRASLLTLMLFVLVGLSLSGGETLPVHAGNITVTSTSNTVANDGNCTLREAIINANNDDQSGSTDCLPGSGADFITLGSNESYLLDIVDNSSSNGPNGLPVINSDITIEGNDSSVLRDLSNATPEIRIFEVGSNGDLSLNSVAVANGVNDFGGGGIFNDGGTLTLNSSMIDSNRSRAGADPSSGKGGGIYNTGDGTVTLNNSEVTNNSAKDGGGGVFNDNGTLELTDSTIGGNTAASGGGIFNQGGLVIVTSIILNNRADFFGGGIETTGLRFSGITGSTIEGNKANFGGGIDLFDTTLSIFDTTFSDNNGKSQGGGANVEFATLNIEGSTLDGNRSDRGGGIFNFGGQVTITNDTLSGNTAFQEGGGVFNSDGDMNITNSTLANNESRNGGGILNLSSNTSVPNLSLVNSIIAQSRRSSDCGGDVAGILSLGHNIDSDGTCNLIGSGDIPNTNPELESLADNGGPTETRALRSTSPAINAGDNSFAPSEDQRDVARPLGGTVDIGAYEFGLTVGVGADLSIVVQPSLPISSNDPTAAYAFVLTNNGPDVSSVDVVHRVPSAFALSNFDSRCTMQSGSKMKCDLGIMASGDVHNIIIEVIPPAVASPTFVNIGALVTGVNNDPNLDNNFDSERVQVTP